jgi:hypothetical protein
VPFAFNSVVGNTRSLLEVLRDICAAGRASPALIDGKWSVNIDEPKTVVQHFSPHNSWGFESVKALPRIPHAIKIKFFNETKDYKEDELTVYNYGYNINNAELFESITLPGVTNPQLVVDHGKWHFAQIKYRPEIYSLNTDIEYLVCNRGDLVKVTHDVPMWGIGSGRIKDRILNTAITSNQVQVTCLELDEKVYMEPTKQYTIRIRNNLGNRNYTDGNLTREIKKSFNVSSYSYINTTDTVTLTLPSADHPLQVGDRIIVSVLSTIDGTFTITEVNGATIKYIVPGLTVSASTTSSSGTISLAGGEYDRIQVTSPLDYVDSQPLDLFLFGELNKESQNLIVLSIEPTNGAKSARLTMVDYGVTDTYNIFTQYANETTASFDSFITDNRKIERENSLSNYKPNITSLFSDDVALDQSSPGVFVIGLIATYTNDETLPTSAEFVQAEIQTTIASHDIPSLIITQSSKSGSYVIRGVEIGTTYKVRMRYVTQNGVVGMWSDWSAPHTVTGKGIPPENVTGFEFEQVEYGLNFKWDACTALDYKSTIIKYVPTSSLDVTWDSNDSVKLFDGKGDSWFWNLPSSGEFLILIRHQDSFGNLSKVATVSDPINFVEINFIPITIDLSNDNHQIPADADGLNPVLDYSGTDIHVYQGGSLLKYDGIGTDVGRWKITNITPVNVTPGTVAPVSNPLTGDDFATINNLAGISNTEDLGSLLFLIEGIDSVGIEFSQTKIQKFVKQKSGENPVLYRINTSTPVVYKNTPDNTTPGDFSTITVHATRKVGNNPVENFGWLGITPYVGTQAGTEAYTSGPEFIATPQNSDTSTKWIVRMYGLDPALVAPGINNPALDTEEILVVFEGEVYNVEVESSNGTVFRPGQNSTTILKARVFKNGEEITESLSSSAFRWRRVSGIPQLPPNDDVTWNTLYTSGYKQISLNVDDVYARATFFCDILI